MIRNGLVVKDAVDAAIDKCSEAFNLRESIEHARIHAEQATNDSQRKLYAQRGKFYFTALVIFTLNLRHRRPAQPEAILRAYCFPVVLVNNRARHHPIGRVV